MSVIGSSCLVLVSGQLHPAIIRAASQPVYKNSDFSQIKVLLEWVERDNQREWADLSKGEKYQAVYHEQSLLWARRVLPTEQSRAVAWPAKAFTLLCGGGVSQSPDTVIVEYFCDKERTQLYLHETKELMLSEARTALSQHPLMLQELNEWEEVIRNRELLTMATTSLTGCRELTLVEDISQMTHTVNPLMVHIVLEEGRRTGSRRSSLQQATSLQQVLLDNGGNQQPQQQQGLWSRNSTTDLTANSDSLHSLNSPSTLGSPHLTSPSVQDCQSPLFNNSTKPFGVYRTPSVDLNHRRSSLQHVNQALMRSEPNLVRRCSLDPIALQQLNNLYDSQQELTQSQSLNQVPLHIHSPPHSGIHHTSPLGSSTQLHSMGTLGGTFPSFESKSKSMDSLFSSQLSPAHQMQKRRASCFPMGSNFGRSNKKARFDLPPIPQEPPSLPALSRSASIPAIFPPSKLDTKFNSHGANSSDQQQQDLDDLELIQDIITKDKSLDNLPTPLRDSALRSQSLSHLPGEFVSSSSLPSLTHSGSMHILHDNYKSEPNFISLPSYETSCKTGGSLMEALGHESQNTDFQSDKMGDQFISQTGRSSLSMSTSGYSAQSTPAFDTQATMFDFSGRRESNQSIQSSSCFSDMENRTPGFDFSRQPESGNISDIGKSFQFPVISSSSGSLTQVSAANMPLSKLLSSNAIGVDHRGQLLPEQTLTSPTPITRIENPSIGGSFTSSRDGVHRIGPALAPDPEPLSPVSESEERMEEECSISTIINRHGVIGRDEGEDLLQHDLSEGPVCLLSPVGSITSPLDKPKKTHVKSTSQDQKDKQKRGRGRPRLTEEEKLRRKELRELGLMKRSKRRTKEEVQKWRADKILSPAKRGRKPGSGKKNLIKAATGKVVFVTVDLSQYPNGTVLLQNGFCRAFPGVPKCLECSTCEGDLPQTRYCRFLEFRKLCIVDNVTPTIKVEGFADYTDVSVEDLVPWTPLKTGYSGMDEGAALQVLSRVVPHFISIVTEEAKTLPDEEVTPVWKRAVRGVRELCDTCDTTLFNFHWVCQHCGFCICPTCYRDACDAEEGSEAVSSMQANWPVCVSNSQPHRPSGLIVAQIIPANVLYEVVMQALKLCEAHHITQPTIPRILQRLFLALGGQQQSRLQNERRRSKGGRTKILSMQPAHPLPPQHLESRYHQQQQPSFPSINDITLELPHSCSNGNDDQFETPPINAPHTWLCDDTLLCLLDVRHEQNMPAFQERWMRGQAVLVAGVNNKMSQDLWTPEAFGREFGEELADLMDCRIHVGLVMLQVPCRTFWSGFENMNLRPRDPATNEPRLLKLKDWPTGEDFSEKLPKRFADLIDALPFPEYTRREGRMNMAASLPDFFVKPDLGPKMYNAYGSPAYPNCGTTNLHLDISDAVNVMVYCSSPPSVEEEERRLIEVTVKRECCPETVRRIQETGARVGALWHIYAASDADKIRALLRKVFEERGLQQPLGTDPIHDQCIYLDSDLRQRLYDEYGVKGWAIAQCRGDAIFIPAGAPHQVRNLCSCIKIAEDFVSPEHVSECLKLTEEFRQLSDRHANHEDKLQIKNIIYHFMKDTVGILKSSIK